jgi:ketosteroid isomerase-like protein
MSSQSNKLIVLQYIDCWNAGDFDGCSLLLAENFRLLGKGMPESGIDHNIDKFKLIENAKRYEGVFQKRITLEVQAILAEGDAVAAQLRSSARLADGRDYANNYSFHVRLRDGKITDIDEYCCTYTVVHSLRAHGVGTNLRTKG